ncbi:phage protein [Streptococcus pyogenes]|nr:phage protein [Streptococcus pyogenes]
MLKALRSEMGGYLPTRSVGRASRRHCTFFLTLGFRKFWRLNFIEKEMLNLKKNFQAKTNRTLYCSEECRKKGNREKQRKLMKQKRDEQRKEKKKVLNPNTDVTEKPKKIRNLAQHYKKLKKEILANESEFGFTGITLIEGIDVHEENFVDLVMQKIKEQK